MVKRIIKILYIKWVLGQCRHLCILCEYRDECMGNICTDDLE